MHKLFLFFICVMLSSVLHGMFNVENTENKNILWGIIVVDSLLHDDYDTYRTLAMLSKVHNKIIEENYRPKKKCIENYNFYKALLYGQAGYTFSWNKDFSKCASVAII